MLVRQVAEPGDVGRHRSSIVVGRLTALQHRQVGRPARAHQMLAEVVTDDAGGVGETVRVEARFRRQEKPRRLERRGGEDHGLGVKFHRPLRLPIDDADARDAIGGRVDQYLGDDRIGPHDAAAGVLGGIDQRGRRMEVRRDVTAAAAAASAHAARPVTVVQQSFGCHAGAAGNQVPVHLRDRFLEDLLAAVQLGRALEDPVGNPRQVLDRARDAEQAIDLVVARRQILVCDRPVLTEPVAGLASEVLRAEPQRAAPPEQRLAAKRPRPHPCVGGSRGRDSRSSTSHDFV